MFLQHLFFTRSMSTQPGVDDSWHKRLKSFVQPRHMVSHFAQFHTLPKYFQNFQKMAEVKLNDAFTIRWQFRSQTSNIMDRWKSGGGKSQRRESENEEDQRRERVIRKKMQVRKKAEKSRNTVFFSNVLWLRRVEKSRKVFHVL